MNESIRILLAGILFWGTGFIAVCADESKPVDWKVVYREDFESIAIGALPEDFFPLDGNFEVGAREGSKCLILPGNPIGEFGFLFGSRNQEKAMECSFSFWMKNQGRRFPSMECAIGGIRGMRLRLDGVGSRMTLAWNDHWISKKITAMEMGIWQRLRLRYDSTMENSSGLVSFKLWNCKGQEPFEWLEIDSSVPPLPAGRCAIWGYPYAGSELRWDDLEIRLIR